MSKNQEYLVLKFNEEGCCYGHCLYYRYADAWADTRKRDVMYVCKPCSVYWDGQRGGWVVDSADIIRTVRRPSICTGSPINTDGGSFPFPR